jgi:pyrroline-5-carboxylate reductase
MKTVGFIGAGNMGEAMIQAILKKNVAKVNFFDINKEKKQSLEAYGATSQLSEEALVKESEYIVLTIKPQYYEDVIAKIKPFLTKEKVIITVAPGFSLERLEALIGGCSVIRTMPNTPALIQKGVSAYCYKEEKVTQEQVEVFKKIFDTFGKSFYVKEEMMEAVVATSGSSPAYGYVMIEAMVDAAVSYGLPRDTAYEMAALSIKGACEMILETKKHPGVLKDQVTSPGGTTIEAIKKLEEKGFRTALIQGMDACYQKANQMKG